MTTIYFVRHAKAALQGGDGALRPLTSQGLRDRELVTAYLNDKGVELVFSSPYTRAIDTVKPFADAHGLPMRLVADFAERKVSGGHWIADFDAYAARQWEDFDYALPDGENLRQVQTRNVNALCALLREHAGRTIAVGSHGTALSTIIHYYDHTFGYAGFCRIQHLMPWIVRFTFVGEQCECIATVDLLAGAQMTVRQCTFDGHGRPCRRESP
jgi:2,3-bisphosphoglycerate-dependent phosphoglycerate mutase